MEPPPASYLDGPFPADGVNWAKFSAGTLSSHMYDMGAFASAWAPLERRWKAGDFSRMQPAQPNPWFPLSQVSDNMMKMAGARQQELEGASSMSGRKNEVLDSLSEVAVGTQDDT